VHQFASNRRICCRMGGRAASGAECAMRKCADEVQTGWMKAGLVEPPHWLRTGVSSGTSTRAAVRAARFFTVLSRSSASKSAVPCDPSQAMEAVK